MQNEARPHSATMIAKIAPLILVMSFSSFFRTASAEEPKLKKVSYRGGLVEFSIPANWKEEYEPEGGGTFYEESADSGILRLNVMTLKSPSALTETSASDALKVLKVAKSRQVDLLPNGNALLHFSEPGVEAGRKLHMVYWFVANPVGTNHVRVATFTYTLLEGQQDQGRFTKQIELLDSEIRKAAFAKELGETGAASILILAVLRVESSYLQEIERPARNVPDTVQFWFAPDSQWRIKTFAIDHDIHVGRIGAPGAEARLTVEFATNNIKKSYGDVTASVLVLEFRDPGNKADVERILNEHKLAGKLEAVKEGYYFYNPDGGNYRTKSKPK